MARKRTRNQGGRNYRKYRRSGQLQRRRRAASFKFRPARPLVEAGYVDYNGGPHAMNTTGSLQLMTTIPQGAATTERVGKRVNLKSFQIRGSVIADSTCQTTVGTYMIVYDKRPTGTLPAITDILVSANSRSMNNDQNSGRFRVLRRKNFVLSGNPTLATDTTTHFVDEFIKCNMQITFKAAGTGAIGDIEEGAVYILTFGTAAPGTADAAFTYTVRTRFHDL